MRLSELQALACQDCDAATTVSRGQGVDGPVLVVVVTHRDSCPWAGRHVPAGGATLVKAGAMLRHVTEGEAGMSGSPHGPSTDL